MTKECIWINIDKHLKDRQVGDENFKSTDVYITVGKRKGAYGLFLDIINPIKVIFDKNVKGSKERSKKLPSSPSLK